MRGPTLFVIAFATYLVNFTHAAGQNQAGLINKRLEVPGGLTQGKVTGGGIGTLDGVTAAFLESDASTKQTVDQQGQVTRRRKKRSLKYNKRLAVPIVDGASTDSGSTGSTGSTGSPLAILDGVPLIGNKGKSEGNGASAATADSNTDNASSSVKPAPKGAEKQSDDLVDGLPLVDGLLKGKGAKAAGSDGQVSAPASQGSSGGLTSGLLKRETGFPAFKPDAAL